MIELTGNALLFFGSFFVLIAALGLCRFPGLYLKMHASTKAGTLGSGLVLLGVAVQIGNIHAITEVLLIVLFISITNPLSAHLIAKVAAKCYEETKSLSTDYPNEMR